MRFLVNINWPITISIILLLSIGILVILSSSKELATGQVIFSIIGLCLYFLISQFDYRALKSLITPAYIFLVILLAIVLIVGIEIRGSTRWISIDIFNMQPSEFLKPALVLFLAQFWSSHRSSWLNILKSFLWILPPTLLIFKQPDLGTTLTILIIWFCMIFASRISVKKIILLSLIFLLMGPIAWFSLHGYQKERVTSFLSPTSDPLGVGYNLIQSTIAVGSGQIFGRGLGHGTQSRLQFLPEFQTDFIFASIAEELGFLGSFIILATYLFLIVFSLKTSENSSDYFGYLIICGVVSAITFQVVVNIGMNIGLFPITGITLPLISYGGSSLIATLLMLGLVASIVKFKRQIDIPTVGG